MMIKQALWVVELATLTPSQLVLEVQMAADIKVI